MEPRTKARRVPWRTGTRPARLVIVAAVAAALLVPAGAVAQQAPVPLDLIYTSESKSVRAGFSQTFAFDVKCPAGTVAIGGGWKGNYFIGATASTPASQSTNGWKVEGLNADNGSGSDTITGHATCATAAAFPTGSLAYPSDSKIRLKPWPEKPRSGAAEVTCPSGMVPIAGGFRTEDETDEIFVAESVAKWAEDGGQQRSWTSNGENSNTAPFTMESWDLYTTATCVSSSLAFGVFGLHAETEEKKLGDLKTVTATCKAGNALAGGYIARNGSGSKLDYTGGFEKMKVTDAGDGFEIAYSSSSIYSHRFTTVAICGEISPAITVLGQADFDAACLTALPQATGVRAVAGPGASTWTCARDEGPAIPIPGNQGTWACAGSQEAADPTATPLRLDDPLSWVCYDRPDGAQSARRVTGTAEGVGGGANGDRVRVTGSTRIVRPMGALAKAQVTVPGTLLEAGARGDLLTDGGDRIGPVVLRRKGAAKGLSGRRTFTYANDAAGTEPRLKLRLRKSPSGKSLVFDLSARGGRVQRPRLCDAGPDATTHLTTRLVVDTGKHEPTDVLGRTTWACGGTTMQTAAPALALP